MMLICLTKQRAIKKNAESLIVVSEKIGLAVNSRKTMYKIMFRNQNTGRSHNITIDNKFFDRRFRTVQIFETNHN